MMNLKPKRKSKIQAQNLLQEIGCDEITDISMDMLTDYLGAFLIEEPLKNSDGRIVQGKNRAIIKINSDIKYESRKRFAIAHEIGHFLMHKNIDIHDENANTLSWFNNAEKQLKKGIQEFEANEFASELLMPSDIFYAEAKGKAFGHELLKYLSERFKTSLTSTVYRYMQLSLHPICVVFMSGGVVKYWKKSDDLRVWVKNITKLSPPSDSVAEEYITGGYNFIYTGADKKQEIDKSTWFTLGDYEKDSCFYEYCIPTKSYKTLLSVIWED